MDDLVFKGIVLIGSKLDIGDAVFFGVKIKAKQTFKQVVTIMDKQTAGDLVGP